ncbi:MAG: ABC transporter substrate-binding protein, partial [Thermodesulfobacteriota bacterium]
MARLILVTFFLFSLVPSSFAAQRLRFGVVIKVPDHELPVLAAEEKGFWEKNGLEAKTTIFKGGGPFGRALAAREVDVGTSGVTGLFMANSRGLPSIMLAAFQKRSSLGIWVAAGGPRKKPKDLAGARLGMSSTGSLPHIYGQAVAKILGLERKIRFVAVGGVATRMAALKSGAIDGHLSPFSAMARFQQEGKLREVLRFSDYLPKEWVATILVAHRETTIAKPTMVARAVKAFFQSIQFMRNDPSWTMQKLSQMRGYS